MENTPSNDSNHIMIFLWIVSLLVVGVVAYGIGKSGTSSPATLSATTVQEPAAAAAAAQTNEPTPTPNLGGFCPKTGPSQKKDYLKPYTLKDGDTINKIAEEQLGDVSRNTEITTLNQDQKQLMVGSIIYLPPDNIRSSSGNLVEVSGKLVRQDNSYWQLSYGEGEKDLSVLMPAYWFKDFPDKNSYKIGDCLTILLDNGVKAYKVSKN